MCLPFWVSVSMEYQLKVFFFFFFNKKSEVLVAFNSHLFIELPTLWRAGGLWS